MDIKNKAGELIYRGSTTGQALTLRNLALRNADFSNHNLQGAYFDECDLTGADFQKADLYGAYLAFSSLNDASFAGASLRGASLDNCLLRRTSFVSADLSPDNLDCPTSMQKADLRGADFRDANLTRLAAESSVFDKTTVFPSGCDPPAHGMVEVKQDS